MSDDEFARLADQVLALTGIELPPHKRQLVISRLRKRLRALGIDGFGDYLAYLASPAGAAAETGEMVNAVTTNQTAFFRERHHFEDLAQILARHPGDAGARPRLQAKLFGGASVTAMSPAIPVGERNRNFALDFLRRAGIPVTAADLGGERARRVFFTPADNKVLVQVLDGDDADRVRREEARLQHRTGAAPASGGAGVFR